MVLKTPAKVNLHLEIRGLRPDGYHEILSVVHSVPLFDRVHIRSLKEKNTLNVHCNPPVTGGKNIVRAAAEAFKATCALETGLEILVEKRIPVGAGLGGGSSDAAAVLSGLNELFAFPLCPERLRELAVGLGSDVTLFLHGSAALMSGRGETIQDLMPRTDLFLVLVYPGFAISTAEAYSWFDQDGVDERRSAAPEDLKFQFEEKDPDSWTFFNSFQSTIERRYPLIGKIRGELEKSGADLATLSGSGSSIVGVFADRRAARSVYRRMRSSVPGAWLLVPLQSGGFAD